MANAASLFAAGPGLGKLRGPYPEAQDVLEAASEGQREKSILARLWISEGIPFAFKDCPGLYEEFRTLLANRLDIDGKQISVAGSGRLGYSLAPEKWGEAYQPAASDLDWFAVSEELFERFYKDFERWRADYDGGAIEPKTEIQRFYWNANRDETPKQISKGFVDSYRVPNWKRYGVFLATNSCLENLRIDLRKANEAPKPPPQLSLRCYRDWTAYERQMGISLKAVVDSKSPA